jgi:hypothetical protein
MAHRRQSEIHDPLLSAEEGQNAHSPPALDTAGPSSPLRAETSENGANANDSTGQNSRVGCFPADASPGSVKMDLLEAFDSRQLARRGTANQLQTVFNTINLYVGVGLVTIGYAVALGGWSSLVNCSPCLGDFRACFVYKVLGPASRWSGTAQEEHAVVR